MLFLELALVLVLVVTNGLLAMSELAIVSARPARLRSMAKKGSAGARRALALAADPGRFLSTVQIGITLVGVLSGAFSGATLGSRLAGWFMVQGMPTNWAFIAGMGVVVTAITYLSLIVGELVPKQLALKDAERIASLVAPAMTVIAKATAPVVWILDKSGKVVLTLIGSRSGEGQRVTEEEIQSIIAEGESAGVIEPSERRMITSLLRLGDRPVRAVMTPRHEVVMIDLSTPVTTALNLVEEGRRSVYPVHDGNPGEVLGVISAKEALAVCRSGQQPDLRALVREAPVLPDSMDALEVVEVLRRSPIEMGLVHDEYGDFEGIITPSDILEAIVGVFVGEHPEEKPIVQRADGSLLVAGWMPADEMADALELVLPANRAYQTVAGFLIEAFGRLPDVGEHVIVQHWRFEILDLDGRRIDKVLAARSSPSVRDERALTG